MKQLGKFGFIGKKLGMTQHIDLHSGHVIPVTVISVQPNVIIEFCSYQHFNSIKVAAFHAKQKGKKSILGIFNKLNLPFYKIIKEFPVIDVSKFSLNEKIGIEQCKKGGFLDISGTTIGKGFSGTMKRHNFGGLEASHGVSKKHRSGGSTGQCQDPGKVFKGKKMSGQYGNKNNTIQNIKIIDIDRTDNLIIVKGSVPGCSNSIIYIKDAVKK